MFSRLLSRSTKPTPSSWAAGSATTLKGSVVFDGRGPRPFQAFVWGSWAGAMQKPRVKCFNFREAVRAAKGGN